VRAPDGTEHLAWRAVAYVLTQSVWAAPLGWLSDLPPLRPTFGRLYAAIGARRRRLGPVVARVLPFRTERTPGSAAMALCGALAVLAFVSNAASLARLSVPVPPLVDAIPSVLQVRQHWLLFAPVPTHVHWDFRVVGRRADGSAADLMAILPEPLIRAPRDLDPVGREPVAFASPRWLKYFSRLDTMSGRERAALGDYLCRLAAAAAAPMRQIELGLAKQVIQPGPVVEIRHDYQFDCAAGG
jgi:hypothetical protein